MAMSALAVYANILADATGMEADPMFPAFGTRTNDQGAAPSLFNPVDARQTQRHIFLTCPL
jgi:hypothetical protein